MWYNDSMVRMALLVVMVFFVVLAACGSDRPSDTPNESGQPQEQLLTGWDILHASEQAMADIGPFVVESRSWIAYRDVPPPETVIHIYDGPSEIRVNPDIHAPEGCDVSVRKDLPFTQRRESGMRDGQPPFPGSEVEEVEILGKETVGDIEAWVVRYIYMQPSFEGPFPVGHTEWIATDDFRLLRIETEQWNPWGFKGQRVRVFRSYNEIDPSECPIDSTIDESDLWPTTDPRLKPAPKP